MKTFRTIWFTILIFAVLIALIMQHEARRHRPRQGGRSAIEYGIHDGYMVSLDPVTT